jgi:hypothetical protein
VGVRYLHHRLVPSRIEPLPGGIEASDAVASQHVQGVLQHQAHAFEQRLAIAARGGMVDRTLEVVDHRKQIPDQRFAGENAAPRSFRAGAAVGNSRIGPLPDVLIPIPGRLRGLLGELPGEPFDGLLRRLAGMLAISAGGGIPPVRTSWDRRRSHVEPIL